MCTGNGYCDMSTCCLKTPIRNKPTPLVTCAAEGLCIAWMLLIQIPVRCKNKKWAAAYPARKNHGQCRMGANLRLLCLLRAQAFTRSHHQAPRFSWSRDKGGVGDLGSFPGSTALLDDFETKQLRRRTEALRSLAPAVPYKSLGCRSSRALAIQIIPVC